MQIPKEIVDQWWAEWHSEGRIQPVLEYIAQRSANYALEKAILAVERNADLYIDDIVAAIRALKGN